MQVKENEKEILSAEHLWYKVKIGIFSLENDGWRDFYWIWFVIKRLVFYSFSEHSGVETLRELTDSAAGLKQLQGITFLNTGEFFVADKMCQWMQQQLSKLMVQRSQQAK